MCQPFGQGEVAGDLDGITGNRSPVAEIPGIPLQPSRKVRGYLLKYGRRAAVPDADSPVADKHQACIVREPVRFRILLVQAVDCKLRFMIHGVP